MYIIIIIFDRQFGLIKIGFAWVLGGFASFRKVREAERKNFPQF